MNTFTGCFFLHDLALKRGIKELKQNRNKKLSMIALKVRLFDMYFFFFYFSHTVKEKLTADPDSEIATTSLRVSLLCPVKRLSAPHKLFRDSVMPRRVCPFLFVCVSHFVLVPLTSSLVRRNCIQPLSSAFSMRVWHVSDTYVTRIASIHAVCVLFMPWLHVSLQTVQLGKMRLMIPCRALTCSHLQCFDATLYIQMNEKKPTWVCPVCDKKAPYEHLIIDG